MINADFSKNQHGSSVTPIMLDFSRPYWLEIVVNAETLSPLRPLVSVGYAFRAEYVNDDVDDADADPENEWNTSLTLNGATLELTDTGGTLSRDLSSLRDDADADTTNELNYGLTLNSATLEVTDANCFGTYNQVEAINSVAGLKHGDCDLTDNSLPGDWRLPSKAEWETTVAQAVALGCTNPALTDTPGTGCYATGAQPFTGVQSNIYRSSTTDANNTVNACFVFLSSGNVQCNLHKGSQVYMWWPVRGGE